MKKYILNLFIIFTLLFSGCAPGYEFPDSVPTQPESVTEVNNVSKEESDNVSLEYILKVHFIDVGQGDAILVTCGEDSMLIDAGDNSMGTTLQMYLNNQGIENLTYVIGTHPDADHIGGLDVVLYKFDCGTIIMPDISKDTATYRDVMDVIDEKGYKVTTPVPGDTYKFGNAEFEIIGPLTQYEDVNDNSVVILLTHGDNKFLFSGDAGEEAESDIVDQWYDISADVYKAGHHGSYASSTDKFLNAVNPAYAVISCGNDNDYGHPHKDALDRLKQHGIKIFRTDEQGTIIAESNGINIVWNKEPSETWKEGIRKEETSAETEISAEAALETYKYVCNTNSMKYHLPGCEAVQDMSENNKLYSNEEKNVLESEGYLPCKICNP